MRLEEKLKRLNSPLALKQWWGGAVSRITLIILNSSHHIQIQSKKLARPFSILALDKIVCERKAKFWKVI